MAGLSVFALDLYSCAQSTSARIKACASAPGPPWPSWRGSPFYRFASVGTRAHPLAHSRLPARFGSPTGHTSQGPSYRVPAAQLQREVKQLVDEWLPTLETNAAQTDVEVLELLLRQLGYEPSVSVQAAS